MEFQLNEDWMSGYISVIGGLLAFVIGVSAIVLQLALPSYLQTLVQRRGLLRYTFGIMFLYFGMAVLIIWIGPVLGLNEISGIGVGIINVGMTVTILCTVLYTMKQLKQINSFRIIESLRDECKADLIKQGHFDDTLTTLIDVGSLSHAGFEKNRVLDALTDLVNFVIHQPNYDGATLKPILRGYEMMLIGGGVRGARDNFTQSAEALRQVIAHLSNHKTHDGADLAVSSDMDEAMRICGLIAIAAMSDFPESTILEFLKAIDAAETEDRKTFFHASKAIGSIGTEAVKHGHYGVAVRALNSLFQWDDEILNEEATQELLGLTAELWNANNGGKEFVFSLLSFHHERFEPSLDHCIEEAVRYHLQDTFRLGTHSRLLKMQNELEPLQAEL